MVVSVVAIFLFEEAVVDAGVVWAGFCVSVFATAALAAGLVIAALLVAAGCSAFFTAAGCWAVALVVVGFASIFLAVDAVVWAGVVDLGVVVALVDWAKMPAVAKERARANAIFFMFLRIEE